VFTATNKTWLVIQLDAVRPSASPAFASSIWLYSMADEIVVAVLF
jgi:hypothetical protein